MLLVTSPTTQVLGEFREALHRREDGVRLLVPTATMADHLLHLLAREGFVLRPSVIATLSQFIVGWTEDMKQVSPAQLSLSVEEAVARVDAPEFGRVRDLAGFHGALATTLEEFSTTGCDPEQLARRLPDTPLAQPFLRVWLEVTSDLRRRNLGMRATRLKRAAARIEHEGLGQIHTVWIHGFLTLTAPELEVARAVSRHAKLTVSVPDSQDAAPREVLVEVFRAPDPDREADEIARQIIAQYKSGRNFREIGIVIRNPDVYLPVFRASLGRFGIPARFYFATPLSDFPPVSSIRALMQALLSGWDYELTLKALRPVIPSPDFDRFDFAVRARLPGCGLETMNGATEELQVLDPWRSARLSAAEWASRLKALPRASGLQAFETALDETAAFLERRGRVPLDVFWKAASTVLSLTPVRSPDRRRDVVHVLSVYEARQWKLPVVYVCGLAETQFPRHHAPDAFFPDAARQQLQQAGIPVRTSADLQQEERFLFDLACTGATSRLVLSYPQSDSRGIVTMPSAFLAEMKVGETAGCPALVRPRQRLDVTATQAVVIRDAALLETLKKRSFSASGLECFLDCPFQFFARHTLRLEARPLRPERRLDFMVQGSIVHKTLAALPKSDQELEVVFTRTFDEVCAANAIPPSYRREALRRQMLEDISRFLQDRQLPTSVSTLTEQSFEIVLDEFVRVRGRIDRIDVTPDGRALIIDYKYSPAQSVSQRARRDDRLQGPLYVLAAERQLGVKPAAMLYCGLRGNARRQEARFAGWADPSVALPMRAAPLTPEWLASGERLALRTAAAIMNGTVAPSPARLDLCGRCDYRDVCRYDGASRAIAAEAR